jgi:two-component system sensor histidine kinase YesM
MPLFGLTYFRALLLNRLLRLSSTVKRYNDEHLELATDTEGDDEIALLARNYNTMAERINYLIDTVYKQKLRESKSIMARQKAELLALKARSILIFSLMLLRVSGCTVSSKGNRKLPG